MAAIRSGNTRPELIVRCALHAVGLRYRLHVRALPGSPDLVFPKYRAALFVHGCFWHQHDCHLFRWPATREDFWRKKIAGNVAGDAHAITALHDLGWRTGIIWECALQGRTRLNREQAMQAIEEWVKSSQQTFSIRGQ